MPGGLRFSLTLLAGGRIVGQRIGYTRVSSLDQNTDRQLDGVALDRTFTDNASGRSTARPQLEAMLAFVRDGDTVLVHSMDRLARNLDDLRALVRTRTVRGVRVQFLKEQLTFTGDDRDGDAAAAGDGGVRRVRALTDPEAPTRRHRAGPQAQRLPAAPGPGPGP